MAEGERSTPLLFKVFRSLPSKTPVQRKPRQTVSRPDSIFLKPTLILLLLFNTHIWSSKDKSLIKPQQERQREKRNFPKQICEMR